MNQQELYDWARPKLKKDKYEIAALMNFRTYLGPMTADCTGSELQLLWARSLAYEAAARTKNLGSGGWYPTPLAFSYNESSQPMSAPPTVVLGEGGVGGKKGKISGAGQCAWFMDAVGNALQPMAGLKKGEIAVLGCYHKTWKHNFVVLAPNESTVTAGDVVMFDAWALAFGVNATECWGAKADESWLKNAWHGITITHVYK